MSALHPISLDQLQTRLDAHTAGHHPHLPFVLVSHVRWPDALSREQLYEALCEHHARRLPWEEPGRHLMIDANGAFWINPNAAWLPTAEANRREPAPALIDMAVGAEQSRPELRNQLQSVAMALLAIGDAFQLDDVPSVRWQSIHLPANDYRVPDTQEPIANCGGF